MISCRAVLFDCDGVLVDSTESGEAAWRQWSLEYGLEPSEVLVGIHGRRSAETVRMFLPAPVWDEGFARIEQIEIDGARHTRAINGALALFASAEQVGAVVTSASAALLVARLTAAGFAPPRIQVTAEDVGRGKPAPEGYLMGATRLGVPPASCVVLEDSLAGVEASLAANVGFVLGVGASALQTRANAVVSDLQGVRYSAGQLHVPGENLIRSTIG